MRPRVRVGLERWIETGPAIARLPREARIGLLAHPASIDGAGHHAIERLLSADAGRLVRLFAPEHGLWGHEQDMEAVPESFDRWSGLPVISWYGHEVSSLTPQGDQLRDLDAVVCDLQDVGTRYYTFIYTLSLAMESAAAAGVPVVVLDRPNPLGGLVVEGPVLEPEWASFVGRHPLPVRHGMTIGELALWFQRRVGIRADLRIVPMEGWERSMSFEQTSLPWVPPSPNMPTPSTARVYPGGCLIEGTNLSEGRGTTTPFELVGAPWLDGLLLARSLRERCDDSAAFRPASFRPMFQKYAGTPCEGVQVIVRDPQRFSPFRVYLHLLQAVRAANPSQFAWRTAPYEFESTRLAIDLLLGRSGLRQALERGVPVADLEAGWREGLESFEAERIDCLLYHVGAEPTDA